MSTQNEDRETVYDLLVVAATRPAAKWGVALDGIVLAGTLVGMVMVATGNPATLLLYLPLHGIMYLICLKDPRAFRLLLLWTKTNGRSMTRRWWGAATATPFCETRGQRRT